jgi:hypothetical protein
MQPPFILPADRPTLEAFNMAPRQRIKDDFRVETRMLPEPFVGRLGAPIIVLLLNPGVAADPAVANEDLRLHEHPTFREVVRRCHRQEATPYPNYFFDPTVTGPGARWNRRVLRRLVDEFGARIVANGITALEYFPYHSLRFAHRRLRVPSQQFTFDALRSAINRGAIVFVTRGKASWEEAVPELIGYDRAFCTRSVQNVVISPKNCPNGYEAALEALRGINGS